ncbi:hypothetical protein [Caballeronia calidae]|uniref:hypothetical protein n=1 Tax=Caballeronia calidae TaxID=1777139 RepID=UPI0012FE1B59|nr:hypothetical protein [Caballeronia calidae]
MRAPRSRPGKAHHASITLHSRGFAAVIFVAVVFFAVLAFALALVALALVVVTLALVLVALLLRVVGLAARLLWSRLFRCFVASSFRLLRAVRLRAG